jgi:hypothetical protein
LTLHSSKRFFVELDEKMYEADDVLTDGDFAALRDLEPVLAVSKRSNRSKRSERFKSLNV